MQHFILSRLLGELNGSLISNGNTVIAKKQGFNSYVNNLNAKALKKIRPFSMYGRVKG